jgi:hypothetical protein
LGKLISWEKIGERFCGGKGKIKVSLHNLNITPKINSK